MHLEVVMKYSLIDTHCDTVKKAYDQKGSLFKNTFQVDLDRCSFLEYTQFFAAFIHPMYKDRAYERAINLIEKFKAEVRESNGRLAFCKSYADYLENKGKMKYQHYAARFAGKEAIFKAISNLLEDKYEISWKNADGKIKMIKFL